MLEDLGIEVDIDWRDLNTAHEVSGLAGIVVRAKKLRVVQQKECVWNDDMTFLAEEVVYIEK